MIRRSSREPREAVARVPDGRRPPWRSGIVRVWFWSLACLALTVGALSTSSILAPILMWCVVAIVLRGVLAVGVSFRGLRDWRQ